MSTARFSNFRSPNDGAMPHFPDGLSAERIVANQIIGNAAFAWDSATSTPAAAPGYASSAAVVSAVHRQMRRCVMAPDGSIVGYLHSTDSRLWEDGSDATSAIAGAGGSLYQVMVEIPLCYYKVERIGTITIWSISDAPQTGYAIHPAFIRGDSVVPYRYYGAYDAAVYDVSAAEYIGGLNADDNTDATPTGLDRVDITASTGDKLVSVSGQYPMVGLTRGEFRQLAANLGSGWHQVDFWLVSLVQLLAVIEIQSFNTQQLLGMGNTQSSYPSSSDSQSDSPHSVAGKSDQSGNQSNYVDTAWMSYRGIENWFGNCWQFVDGLNYDGDNQIPYVASDSSAFVDGDVSSNSSYTSLGVTLPTSNGYVKDLQGVANVFLPLSVGGSSSTYITDYFWRNAGWRVAVFGGDASHSSLAGGLCWHLSYDSVVRYRGIGARLAR